MERRKFILGVGATLGARMIPTPAFANPGSQLAQLESNVGGRVGVAAIDTGSGARLGHRVDERFAMCSTFKWVLAAAVLAAVDSGHLSLDQRVAYGPRDLLEHAPVTAAQVAEGSLPVRSLCEAAVTVSDNTAANLLLKSIGGPQALTRYLRGVGDSITRLDRNELALNTNLPNDPRDTTTPVAMVATMQKILLGNTLSGDSRAILIDWLKNCKTGLQRLRAGLPPNWTAGDKTGTGVNGATNDVAIIWPPGRSPILIAAYMSESHASADALDAAHARIGRIVTAAFS